MRQRHAPSDAVSAAGDGALPGSVALDATSAIADSSFRANKYFELYAILGVRVVYSFDDDLSHVTITQHFDVRKRRSGGPSGWCARVTLRSQDYFLYRDEDGNAVPAQLIRDDRDCHYVVADLGANKKDVVICFSTQTRQNTAALLNEFTPRKRVLFLSRVYGSSFNSCEFEVHAPRTWKLVNSIPALSFRNGAHRHSVPASHLEPVSVALTFRKRIFPQLGALFGRDAHPLTWVVVAFALASFAAVLRTLFAERKVMP